MTDECDCTRRGVAWRARRRRSRLPDPGDGRARRHDARPSVVARSARTRVLDEAQSDRSRRGAWSRRFHSARLGRATAARRRRPSFGMADPFRNPAPARGRARRRAQSSLPCLRLFCGARPVAAVHARCGLFRRRPAARSRGRVDHHQGRRRGAGARPRPELRGFHGQPRRDVLRHLGAARDLRRHIPGKGLPGAARRPRRRLSSFVSDSYRHARSAAAR